MRFIHTLIVERKTQSGIEGYLLTIKTGAFGEDSWWANADYLRYENELNRDEPLQTGYLNLFHPLASRNDTTNTSPPSHVDDTTKEKQVPVLHLMGVFNASFA